jgi:hypothetical protein
MGSTLADELRMIGLHVGIDEYLDGIPLLRRCRNDVQHAHQLLG